ncbi:SH3 domain-binding glutamic acid-rich-like protein 3 [Asterias amurensis]|uniref:SH3 domain-binding glutamic acid-rich-like protein 3 n=1 Tax=Asterias amurensis TaxID=7602 RepID=UPI003AB3E5AC
MGITVYVSTVSSNMEIKKHQQRITMILSSKKFEFEEVDIASSEDDKKRMREICGDEKALPPQITNGDQYCGDFAKFEEAVEEETLEEFLKLK